MRGVARRLVLVAIAVLVSCFALFHYIPSSTTSEPSPPAGPAPEGPPKENVAGEHAVGNGGEGPPRVPTQEEEGSIAPGGDRHPRAHLSKEMQEILVWDPPQERGQYPPYVWYKDRDYDPNRWEGFDNENGFFEHNGINLIRESKNIEPKPYAPYPDYNSDRWHEQWEGDYFPCQGPRGVVYNESPDDWVKAWDALPDDFPPPNIGSYEAVGLDGSRCFDRYSRYAPYGYGDEEQQGATAGWTPPTRKVNWERVNWGDLQNDCLARNKNRFPLYARSASVLNSGTTIPEALDVTDGKENAETHKQYRKRTAVLIRTWDSYSYTPNDIQVIRALVTELSLLSGGEYQVYLFVNVKIVDEAIFDNKAAYEMALRRYVPKELRSIAVLWTEKVCQEWYPAVGEWGVYWQQFMPVQWFSKMHPEYDFVWNWEMDARYTGQHYHFLEKVTDFARDQPRKYLWERNARYYIPAQHGSFEEYTRDTNSIINASLSSLIDGSDGGIIPVWGPRPWEVHQQLFGLTPFDGWAPRYAPFDIKSEDFSWGVGEEADLITLLPLWDPTHTEWAYRDKLFNYPTSPAATDEHPYPNVPRRVFINTVIRFSKALLNAMHEENKQGKSMASELWPGSAALQHGFKAVYAPHPIWTDRKWPAWYADAVFNAAGDSMCTTNGPCDARHVAGMHAAVADKDASSGSEAKRKAAARWGSRRDAPYSPDREHNFGGWSWYFWSDLPRLLYRRWLGWPEQPGPGRNTGMVGRGGDESWLGEVGSEEWERTKGRMCLPGMLLHPVKNVRRDEGG